MQKNKSPLFDILLDVVNNKLTSGEDADSNSISTDLSRQFPDEEVRLSWVATSMHEIATALECEVVSVKGSKIADEPYVSTFIPNPREMVKSFGPFVE